MESVSVKIPDINASHGASYALREALVDVPLTELGNGQDASVTCAEFWDNNLYVGSSAGEVLHYVLIPADSPFADASFILATRLQLPVIESARGQAGIEQILVLPQPGKACILCNGNLRFYSLPELSPAFGSRDLQNVAWVGGVDADAPEDQLRDDTSTEIMICQEKSIRLWKISAESNPKQLRTISLKGCLAISRRGDIACGANGKSYTLLNIVEQQQIPLFDISSNSTPPNEEDLGLNVVSPTKNTRSMSSSLRPPDSSFSPERGHNRSVSLGDALARSQAQDYEDSLPPRRSSLSPRPPSKSPSRSISPKKRPQTPGVAIDNVVAEDMPKDATTRPQSLTPNICTPSTSEFLLTMGTTREESGVGMFVNLEGEVVRGTLSFDRYPLSLLVDNHDGSSQSAPRPDATPYEGYVLALMPRGQEADRTEYGIEVHRWDLDLADSEARKKDWIPIGSRSFGTDRPEEVHSTHTSPGMRAVISSNPLVSRDIVEILALKPVDLHLQSKSPLHRQDIDAPQSKQREKAEADFVLGMTTSQAKLMGWYGKNIWWIARNTLTSRFDTILEVATAHEDGLIDRSSIEQVVANTRDMEPKTELDFLGLKYVKQKASLILFLDILDRSYSNSTVYDHDKRATEEALILGEIDPRFVIALLPTLRHELEESRNGMWQPGGVKRLFDRFFSRHDLTVLQTEHKYPDSAILHIVKRYLVHWQSKKGFGSVADEREVFFSVDAALLHILLVLDRDTPKGMGAKGSIRAELTSGLIGQGIECFDRGVELLEQFDRLYVLSRLYQSQKMSEKVLATWRRIIEGEEDAGGELADGETQVRKYLSVIRDQKLIEEYGTWLAARHPELGVRVFAEDNSRVKFDAQYTVDMLKRRAPNAVKHFLEYLVFGKNQPRYANDLIEYYLDSVLEQLEGDGPAKEILLTSYATYRAIRPPKPPYSSFATDNGPDEDWWRNRLRLLQLLGGSHGAASQYDVPRILSRISKYDQELVPEMIILDGRQGRHRQAIRLLTQGLGDFDTAVSYCALGGSSMYGPTTGSFERTTPSKEEQVALFGYLLEEFFLIEDEEDRVSQSSELLTRFAGWFDISQVLSIVPESWSVELLSSFLQSALRQIVSERRESAVAKALTSAENLKASSVFVEKLSEYKPKVERSSHDIDSAYGSREE